MGKWIGIDLGTTNSAVAVMEGDTPKVIANSLGGFTTPSAVSYSKDKDEILVGEPAKRQAVLNPENTIYSSKRFIGRLFSEVQKEISSYPFKVSQKSQASTCVFKVKDQEVTPEKVASLILAQLKKDAEAYLGTEVKEAVITVPAYFNDSQRQATKDAGKIAGLDVKRIINEPTAAAFFYGLNRQKKSGSKKVAVYDFGGGTFDISILEVADQVVEVKATNGDTQLGGDDFDQVILNWMVEEFKSKEGVDLKQDKMALQRLKEAAEKAKKDLSGSSETSISLPFITAGKEGDAKHLELTLSLSKFNQLTEHLIERSLKPCGVVLKDADMSVSDIDDVLMVGGSTRIPAIQEAVKNFFNKKELNLSLNPDQAVACGAAVQAGVLSGSSKDSLDILLLDVTSLSLGIETQGGVMTTLIPKNTTIPTKKSEVFSTAEDNQTIVSIHVLQGERQMAQDNKTLGRFDLTNIPPAPRGVPQIEVSFDIDANGIINVEAKDKVTGNHKDIKIDRQSLSKEEIDQMVKEAEVYEKQDKEKKELVTLRNELDQQTYQAEKLLKENKDKVDETLKGKVEKIVNEAKALLKKPDVTLQELKNMKESMMKDFQDLGAQIYKQAKQAKDGAQGATGDEASKKDKTPKDDDPVDVKYDKKDE